MKTSIPIINIMVGGLLSLAFAPFHFWVLTLLCPILLLSRMARFFWFGMGFFGAGVSWVYVSIHTFGEVNCLIAGFITLLFIFLLASLFSLQGILLRPFHQHPIKKYLLAFPAIWTLVEWIRQWLFTGFPWLYLGYSQTNSPLAGFIPVVGIFGTSFITVFCVGLIFYVMSTQKYKYISCLILIFLAGYILSQLNWTRKISAPISVSLVQGDIPQLLKWDPAAAASTLNTYQTLTEKNWSNLVIWPEAAVPLTLNDADNFLKLLNIHALKHHTTLITGIPVEISDQGFLNAAIALGNGSGIYAKRHLVPFGEYIPFYHIFGNFMKILNIPFPDSLAGNSQQAGLIATIHSQQLVISPFICYEIAYSPLLYSDLPQANLLINISNDDWFGHSAAAAQQLQIAQARALESGRYLLTSTNDGITAIINAHGKTLNTFPRFIPGVLTGTVYGMSGRTPWAVWGDTPFILLLFLLLGVLICRSLGIYFHLQIRNQMRNDNDEKIIRTTTN